MDNPNGEIVTNQLRAVLVCDVVYVGREVAKRFERRGPVFPRLLALQALFEDLKIQLTGIDLIVPGESTFPDETPVDTALFEAWWAIESAWADQILGDVNLHSAVVDGARPTSPALATLCALRRSDELAISGDADIVITMTSTVEANHAITYARGVPVLHATSNVKHADAHIQLDVSWLDRLALRASASELESSIVDGRIVIGGEPVSSHLLTPLGRDEGTAMLNTADRGAIIAAESELLKRLSPETTDSDETTLWHEEVRLETERLAELSKFLKLGEDSTAFVVEDLDTSEVESHLIALLYRVAHDYETINTTFFTWLPGVLQVTTRLDVYDFPHAAQFTRLLVPDSALTLAERAPNAYHGYRRHLGARRVVIGSEAIDVLLDRPSNQLTVIRDPDVFDWQATEEAVQLPMAEAPIEGFGITGTRMFIMVDAEEHIGVPAADMDGTWLPLSIPSVAEFRVSPPELRGGDVVECVLNPRGTAWVIMSDPTERRSVVRSNVQQLAA